MLNWIIFILFLCVISFFLMNTVRNRQHKSFANFSSFRTQSLFVVCRSCGSHLQKGDGSVSCHKCHHSV